MNNQATIKATATFEESSIAKNAIEALAIQLNVNLEVADYIFWELYVEGSNSRDIVFEEMAVAYYANTQLKLTESLIPSDVCLFGKHFQVTR